MTFKKIGYIEPMDAPQGMPCRGCDMPSTPDNPVIQTGVAVDGRPLFGHKNCESLKGSEMPVAVAANLGLIDWPGEELDVWAWTASFKYADPNSTEESTVQQTFPVPDTKPTPVDPMTSTQAESDYAKGDTGASVPPSK